MANTIILSSIVGILIGMFGPGSVWVRMALASLCGFCIGFFNLGNF